MTDTRPRQTTAAMPTEVIGLPRPLPVPVEVPVPAEPPPPAPHDEPAGGTPVRTAPGRGTVYTARRDEPARAAGFRARPPHAGWHDATARELSRFRFGAVHSGLIVGLDGERAPATVSLFGATGRRMVLVGGRWLARLMVFRAFALGPRVAVCTEQPPEWADLGRVATGREDRYAILPGARVLDVTGSAAMPALCVYDVGDPVRDPVPGPWRSQLTALSRITSASAAVFDRADIVICQRLTVGEANGVIATLGLPAHAAGTLRNLHGDMVAVLRPDGVRCVWLAPTPLERRALGLGQVR